MPAPLPRKTTFQSRNALCQIPVDELVERGEPYLNAVDENLAYDAGAVASDIATRERSKTGFWARTRNKIGVGAGGLGSVLFVLDVATTGGAVTVFGAAAAALGFGGFVSSGFDYWKLSADENARTTELSDLTKEAEQIRATRAHLRQARDVLRPKTTWQTASGDPTLEPARKSPPPDKP